MINRRNPVPLYIQLKEELLDKIKDEIWERGYQIPTEKELIEIYDLSRATVRKAVEILINEGYLYIKKGIGTFVARKHPAIGFEPLISLTYSLEARGIQAKNRVEKKEVIVPNRKLLKKLRWKEQDSCFYLKRLRLVKEMPLAIEESYFSKKYQLNQKGVDLSGSLAKILLQDLKIVISKIEQIVTPRLPSTKEQQELQIEQDKLILNMERWIYIEDQAAPFYYLKFIIPGDIYSYSY